MIDVYCDGARKKTGMGGYGYLIKSMGQIGFSGGYLENITNNAAELHAAIKVCEESAHMNITGHIIIHCDSQYFVNGFNEWMDRWSKQNWTKIGGPKNKQVANLDQWKKLLEYKESLSVRAKWIRGHSGNELNEFADRIANHCHSNECSIKGVVPIGIDLESLDLHQFKLNIK